ncbi:PAS domain S-box protein [Plectonema radiosum NIES-515]|uniref:histidine kinase n=1 Tax=Plectonema radiosum NIES-515 TaxID=2986073 RepID=A0ABT3AVX0_9CYAN|nr:PAS domain S-box protein [Plectonema radiosum]MCV3213263.1 PAS domain S-box protein [Plectonema radiosum NIES-515]
MNSLTVKNEARRLEALRQYQILDTPPEEVFDDLAFLAAQICGTAIAAINLIDSNRHWFKAKIGLDVQQMPRDMGFCPFCIEKYDALVIPDTLADERYACNPVVTSEPYVRFYAGVPLITPGGEAIGTVCIVDQKPREINDEQLEALKAISRLIIRQLEIRRNLIELASIKTDYKQAKEALHQSECTLRSFFDSAPMMMGTVELRYDDIRHIYDNAASAKFFGVTPEAMKNRFASNMGVPQKYVRQWINYYHQAEKTRSPVSFEYLHETGDAKKWLRATVSSIAACCHNPQRFAYVIEDITERKQAEKERLQILAREQATQNRITNIFESIADGFFALDHEWRFTYINKQAEPLLQRSKEELLGKNIWDEFPDAVDSKFYREYHSSVTQQISVQFEEFYPPFDTWFAVHAYPSKEGLYVYFKDITKRKQAEQQIREQAALLDISTDAIVVRDLSNKILLWNKSAEKLYGWKAEEAMCLNINQFDNESLPQPEIFQTVLKDNSWQGELQKYTKSGKQIIVESRWTLVRDEHQKAKSILVVDTDITQKKQIETQILRAQRMESIGTLASGIAHDLNNMLSPILMSVPLLKAKLSDERSHKVLSIVENNAKRGASLVKQVLSFARGIEGDRTVLQLKHQILEMKQIMEQTFPKSITLEKEIQPDLWQICGDSTQIHQVLMNLCVNARDAMPNGGTLNISAKNIFIDENFARMQLDAKIGYYILLSVADTGIGISQETLERIFEPFFTTKEFGKGTGLGLSTVMGIVKGHGGFITVSSALNKGTKFQVYLPGVNTDAIRQEENQEILTGHEELILIADDEASIREITTTSLEKYNYKAITASDGIEAIALYAQHKNEIKAAIIDMMMPNMDGATTINTLKKMNPLLPIIAVSGLPTSEQVLLNKTYQHAAFLPKPYTTQELLQSLHQVLN